MAATITTLNPILKNSYPKGKIRSVKQLAAKRILDKIKNGK